MKTTRRKTTKRKRRKTATATRGRKSGAKQDRSKIARLAHELRDAQEQQAATAEILHEIGRAHV